MEASILQLAPGRTVRSKGTTMKRKKEKYKKNFKMEDKFDAEDYTLVEYLSAISGWVGF